MSLPALLALRGSDKPDALAFVSLRNGEEVDDAVTYRQLHLDMLARAGSLAELGMRGSTAVLMYPTGLEFVRGLLGCAGAAIWAAPVPVPTDRESLRRVREVADDAGTSVLLTTQDVRDRIAEDFPDAPELDGLDLVATDTLPAGGSVPLPVLSPGDVALLQYTSRPAATPKGVMVTHQNFWYSASATSALCGCQPGDKVVSWLSLCQPTGLMFGVVLPLWVGMTSYLLPPETFFGRPARWLEAISRFGGTHTAAPDDAYERCVRQPRLAAGTDLSTLRVAVNGADRVRPAVLREFIRTFAPYGLAARALAPGYGLAEHTLTVSGSPPGRGPKSVRLSARDLDAGLVTEAAPPRRGRRAARAAISGAAGPDEDTIEVISRGSPGSRVAVRIVDPRTSCPAVPGRVGEIWVSGPCVAQGYLGRKSESQWTFRARIPGEIDQGERYLRTGDLGFLKDGQLYVTGRLAT